jgi:hypothetical protein
LGFVSSSEAEEGVDMEILFGRMRTVGGDDGGARKLIQVNC